MKLGVSLFFLLYASQLCWAGELPSRVREVLSNHSFQQLLTSAESDLAIRSEEALDVAAALWEKYREELKNEPIRQLEYQGSEIRVADKVMKYASFKVGAPPAKGYPLYIALHGGGSGPSFINDSQWEDMKTYYRRSVKEGIYVAPRGITDTWNLHFRPESYILYDRLIENMILFENVDPNRVYILGFSAGGDGVYQIATRMCDRWAAANMSAGHPNGVSPINLYHLPFLIQVGEKDAAFNRNKVAAGYAETLNELHLKNPDGYSHQIFIHYNKPHNFRDNDPQESLQTILADPQGWLTREDRATSQANTNAVNWLKEHIRNPLPKRVIWDLKTRANREADGFWLSPTHGQQQYWLDIGHETAESLAEDEIIASIDPSRNSIVVEKAKSYLKLLLSRNLLDFKRPVHIQIGSQEWDTWVEPNLKTMVKTLADRGDPNYLFDAQVTLTEKEGHWSISTAH